MVGVDRESFQRLLLRLLLSQHTDSANVGAFGIALIFLCCPRPPACPLFVFLSQRNRADSFHVVFRGISFFVFLREIARIAPNPFLNFFERRSLGLGR